MFRTYTVNSKNIKSAAVLHDAELKGDIVCYWGNKKGVVYDSQIFDFKFSFIKEFSHSRWTNSW